MSFGNADDFFKFVRDEDVKYVDVRFTDLPGIQQQVTMPIEAICRSVFSIVV